MRYSHLQISQYCIEAYLRHDGEVGNFQYIHPKPDLLLFRGTDQLRDIYSDWKMILHWRFVKELEPLFQHLVNDLELKFPITVGGHSMGADIAKEFAVWLLARGYSVDQVIVFAPPRTGRRKSIKKIYVGHRAGPDLVTYGPGLFHVNRLISLANGFTWFYTRHKMSEYHNRMKKKYGVAE